MSIFAGVVSRRSDDSLPSGVTSALRAALSRDPRDASSLSEFHARGASIVSLELGILGGRSTFADGSTSAWLAGDPVLPQAPAGPSVERTEALGMLAVGVMSRNYTILRHCRGTYCAAVYDAHRRCLTLVVDKLGVRPLYCWVGAEIAVFATALRIIEALPFCSRRLDLAGVAEAACFGYPLADRTPYREVFCPSSAEIVSVDSVGLHRERYWQWDALPEAPERGASSTETVYRHFTDAVRLRLGRQKRAAAFLSGGLDSRVIVAALKGEGADVVTANFGDVGSQDQAFGRMAAEKLGVEYHQLARQARVTGDSYSTGTVGAWLASTQYTTSAPDRPRVIWSGDGGSVGLGHVYLNSAIVSAIREGRSVEAIAAFQQHNRWRLQSRLLRRNIAREFDRLVRRGVQDELDSLHPPDPGRKFYLFLMLNDQRRHMANHFENLDLTRVEFEMPFFDGEFVAAIVREPIDPFLRHAFYLEWMQHFQPAVLEVPWQAYPGHVPCPLPVSQELTWQWQRTASSTISEATRRELLARTRSLLQERHFRRQFLDGTRMRLFTLVTRWSRADRSYLLHVPSVIARYWAHSKGVAGESYPSNCRGISGPMNRTGMSPNQPTRARSNRPLRHQDNVSSNP